jgi:hypothetical protein
VKAMIENEKRKSNRVDSVNLLNYVYFDENEKEESQGMGRTLNVSESGILLETHAVLQLQHTVSLNICFEESMVDIRGKVIFSNQNKQGHSESGIQFMDVTDEVRTVLRKYAQAFSAQ